MGIVSDGIDADPTIILARRDSVTRRMREHVDMENRKGAA
jgi:hypothetical protein